MIKLSELKEKLKTSRPAGWDALPDLSLYMDQVISYMPRQLISFENEPLLTSAMVNNYIKDGLLPRAEGKKYNRIHLASLTAICALKQVLSVREIRQLLDNRDQIGLSEAQYDWFRDILDRELSETAQSIPDDLSEADITATATVLALRSYTNKLACERLLAMLNETSHTPDKPKK
jgi:DNA-binding transcriptional MerR regulator